MSENKPPDFKSEEVQQALLDWWNDLGDHRGERAELRRCRNVDEVRLLPGYHRLRRSLDRHGFPVRKHDAQLGAVAGLLAHIKEDVRGSFAEQMATPASGSNKARLSGLRFRRLLRIADRATLYHPLIRVLRLLDGKANVRAVAKDVFLWGMGVRQRWALHYYEKAPEET